MIPKIIHYCWFGNGELTPLAKKCIASWKKHCPDYEIRCWNETNYDFQKNKYMKDAYDHRKWGFVPDYARLDIIYQFGGFYLDTDVELLKSLDGLLKYPCVVGEEKTGTVNLGQGFGAEAGNEVIKKLLDQYEHLNFINEDGTLNLTPSPIFQTQVLKEIGYNKANKITAINKSCFVFPKKFFNPKNMNTGKIELTHETVSIHHFAGSWVDGYSKFRGKMFRFINRVFGQKNANRIRKIVGRKNKG